VIIEKAFTMLREEYYIGTREKKEQTNLYKRSINYAFYTGSLVILIALGLCFQLYLWVIRGLCILFPRKADRWYPVYEDAYVMKADAMTLRGEWDKAQKALETAYSIMPDQRPPDVPATAKALEQPDN